MALTKRYVTQDGAGDLSGTSSDFSNAMSWAGMITDLNTPRAGYKYIVKGNVANAGTTTTLTGDGSTTSPNVIEGCQTSEGDLYANGRSSGGALNTANFPVISYTGTGRFDASGATHLVIACLSITSAASNPTVTLGLANTIKNCSVSNTGTNASSVCISMTAAGQDLIIENNDCITASTGAGHAIRTTASDSIIIGNRVKCAPGTGIVTRDSIVMGNTIYECTNGIASDQTTTYLRILNNTIVNCTADGIDITTGSTQAHVIKGNHITGCGGYGIDFNTSTCAKRLGHNRFRDNTSGNVNGGGDWEEGTSQSDVTSNDTDADDFVDQASDDYSLVAGAPATSKGIGYLIDIGANGTPVVTASGGAHVIGS